MIHAESISDSFSSLSTMDKLKLCNDVVSVIVWC